MNQSLLQRYQCIDDGVLGGYGKLTPADVIGSNAFMDQLKSMNPSLQFQRAADCGAGIGRVTKNFLLSRFQHVDLVEQSPRLLEGAPAYIGPESSRVSLVLSGLQTFTPTGPIYDVIWIQWVIGHLHDLDFIEFLQRCKAGLRPDGYVVMKENCPEAWTFVVDKVTCICCHSNHHYYYYYYCNRNKNKNKIDGQFCVKMQGIYQDIGQAGRI